MRGDSVIPGSKSPQHLSAALPARLGSRVAVAVDEDGQVIYHIVSTARSNLLFVALITLMLISTLIAFMSWRNGRQIDQIQDIPAIKQGLEKEAAK